MCFQDARDGGQARSVGVGELINDDGNADERGAARLNELVRSRGLASAFDPIVDEHEPVVLVH